MGIFEQMRELQRAVDLINKVISNTQNLVTLTFKDNRQFSVRLDQEIDLVVATFPELRSD